MKAMKNAASLVLCLPLVFLPLGACGGGEDDVEERLEDRGTAELMEDIEDDEYEPPADGELSEDQIAMFLEVRERALEIRQVAQKNLEGRAQDEEGDEREMSVFGALGALGDAGDYATADLRAADELGHNTAEYEWVEQTVIDALAGHWGRQVQGAVARQMTAGKEQLRAQLQTMLESTEDPAQREQLESTLAELEAQEAPETDTADLTAADRHNLALALEHEDEIRAALMPEEGVFLPSREQLDELRGQGVAQ